MLHEFLSTNREELISRCREKVAKRSAPEPTDEELQYGIPIFLNQLVGILRGEDPACTWKDSPVSRDTIDAARVMAKTAAKHGNELLLGGFTVNQVVHDYGDLCQAVTELAIKTHAPITNIEFHTLNQCLDNAIASAVSEYGRDNVELVELTEAHTVNASQALAERQLYLINMAIVAVDAIKSGSVGITGATGGVLDRSLRFLRDLTVRALADDRPGTGIPPL